MLTKIKEHVNLSKCCLQAVLHFSSLFFVGQDYCEIIPSYGNVDNLSFAEPRCPYISVVEVQLQNQPQIKEIGLCVIQFRNQSPDMLMYEQSKYTERVSMLAQVLSFYGLE